MNGWKLLEKIRSRSVAERRILSFFLAAGITAVIAISWLTVAVGNFGTPPEEIVEENTASPFDAMRAQFGAIKEEFSNLRKETDPAIEAIGDVTNEFGELIKNGTSSTSTFKYLQFEPLEEGKNQTDATTSDEVIIEAEIEESETGTSTSSSDEIEQTE